MVRGRGHAAGLIGAAGACLVLAGCSFEQSALHPAGREAEELSALTWFMFGAAVVVWCIVMAIATYAVLGRKRPRSEAFSDRFILIGGVAFPTISLAILLVFGLSLLPSWSSAEPADLKVRVTAEQFWWRLQYELPGGGLVETANELHLPAGAIVQFDLTSTDVIHSFWIPALGGKMDAIPGRTNALRLTPTKPGTYRGVCAEFCGPSHALMAFPVLVKEPAEFAVWLEGQQAPAARPEALFASAGCAACHTIRGTDAAGRVGPDLTHFGSRRTIGAGTLDNTPGNLAAWIEAPTHIKPGAGMPSFAFLAEAERRVLADYLMGLK